MLQSATWNSVGLSNLPVVVEPLLGHLRHHQRGPGDVLLGHHQPGLRHQHVQPVTEEILLPTQLSARQEVNRKNFPDEDCQNIFLALPFGLYIYLSLVMRGRKADLL